MMARMEAYDMWRVEEMERMHEEAVRMQFSAELPDVEVNLFPSTLSNRLENSKHTPSPSSLQNQEDGTCESVLSDYSASGDAESMYSATSGYTSAASLGEESSFVGDDNPDCLPTLRVWINLAAHLAQEDISDPVEFVEQYHAVTRYVRPFRSGFSG